MKSGTYDILLGYLTAVAKNNGFKSDDFYLNLEEKIKNGWHYLKDKKHAEISDFLDGIIENSTFIEDEI